MMHGAVSAPSCMRLLAAMQYTNNGDYAYPHDVEYKVMNHLPPAARLYLTLSAVRSNLPASSWWARVRLLRPLDISRRLGSIHTYLVSHQLPVCELVEVCIALSS
jgi:hypothetical protein